MIEFLLNNKLVSTDKPAGMVMVDFIRYHQNLMGTKIGCREGDCGACTILTGELHDGLKYRTATSCLMPLANAHGKHIVTIEGINLKGLNPVQQAMCDEGATQCGFCTPGIVMSLTGFCLGNPLASQRENNGSSRVEQLTASVDGNICRCTGYKSIERAALRVGALMQDFNGEDPVQFLTLNSILPAYFSGITERLQQIQNRFVVTEGKNNSSREYNNGSAFLGGGTDLYVQQPELLLHSKSDFMFDRADLRGIYLRRMIAFWVRQ